MDKCCELNYSRIFSMSFSSYSSFLFFNCLFFFISHTPAYVLGKADTYFSNMLLPWCFSNCSAESEKENSEWEKFNCSIERERGRGRGRLLYKALTCCGYFLPWKGSELELQKEGKAWAEQQAEYIFVLIHNMFYH